MGTASRLTAGAFATGSPPSYEFVPANAAAFPVEVFFKSCPQQKNAPPTDFGTYNRHLGNPPAAYSEDGRDGFKKLDGQTFAVCKWDRDCPGPDDTRMVHVVKWCCSKVDDASVTECSLKEYGWLFLADLDIRDRSNSDMAKRAGESREIKLRDFEQQARNLEKQIAEARERQERNERWKEEELRKMKEEHREEMSYLEGQLKIAVRSIGDLSK